MTTPRDFFQFVRRLLGVVTYVACAATVLGVAAASAQSVPTKAVTAKPVTADYDPTRRAPDKIAARRDGPRALLWELKSRDGSKTLYLFGTIHVGKPDFYPLPSAVQTAIERSSVIVVEADVTDQTDAAEMARLMDYPKGETIDRHISPSLLTRLKAQLEKRRIPYANVAAMRPVILSGMLPVVEYMQLGYDINSGLDLALIRQARRDGKKLAQLESPVGQVRLMTAMPAPLQEAFLDNALTMIEQGRSSEQVTGMVNAWQLGDAKFMLELADEASRGQRETDQLNQILLWGRHPAMLDKIEAFLATGDTHFVAVGSLHLVGPRGLVNLLAERGHQLVQR